MSRVDVMSRAQVCDACWRHVTCTGVSCFHDVTCTGVWRVCVRCHELRWQVVKRRCYSAHPAVLSAQVRVL